MKLGKKFKKKLFEYRSSYINFFAQLNLPSLYYLNFLIKF